MVTAHCKMEKITKGLYCNFIDVFVKKINRDVFLATGESLDDRLERLLIISKKINEHNYELIEIWKCVFQNAIARSPELQHFIEECKNDENHWMGMNGIEWEPLDSRHAFSGGRTGNAVKVFNCQYSDKIKYVDVCSLYPFICKRGEYPVGHPKIYVGREECTRVMGINNDISKVNGLIKCQVLPPQNLYHPLLPVRILGKLIFPLCCTCCQQMIQETCPHKNPNERILVGIWVSKEPKEVVQHGYVIKCVYEIWHYEMTRYNQEERKGGIFAEYINEFFKQKVMASGYPTGCITDRDKDEYIKNLKILKVYV